MIKKFLIIEFSFKAISLRKHLFRVNNSSVSSAGYTVNKNKRRKLIAGYDPHHAEN